MGGDFSPNLNLHDTIHCAVSRLLVGRFFFLKCCCAVAETWFFGAVVSYVLLLSERGSNSWSKRVASIGGQCVFNPSLATRCCLSARQNVKFIDLEYVSCHYFTWRLIYILIYIYTYRRRRISAYHLVVFSKSFFIYFFLYIFVIPRSLKWHCP